MSRVTNLGVGEVFVGDDESQQITVALKQPNYESYAEVMPFDAISSSEQEFHRKTPVEVILKLYRIECISDNGIKNLSQDPFYSATRNVANIISKQIKCLEESELADRRVSMTPTMSKDGIDRQENVRTRYNSFFV